MVQKSVDQSECRLLKLQYITNKLRYGAEVLYVSRHPLKQQI